MRRSLVSLAVLLLGGASLGEPEADERDPAPPSAVDRPSAYAVVSASTDGSPYAEREVAGVPWSHGQSYDGVDLHDLRAAFGAFGPAPRARPATAGADAPNMDHA